MPSPEILLRQRYFFSLFTTTLLIALTTQSSLAFGIKPNSFLTVGATEDWVPEANYTLTNKKKGTTKLNPTKVKNLTRGGTAGFLKTLRQSFPRWTFSSASKDLSGSFEVKKYKALGTSEYKALTGESNGVGAQFVLEYTPGASDPTPQHNLIHWIQRVVSNHKVTHKVAEPKDHGMFEDVIDVLFGIQTDPYYDSFAGYRPFDERTFYDLSGREADKNHNWLAELYLVEETAPQTVTIYNGIQWGWKNNVQSVPEPFTILGAGVSLGFGVLFKKTYSRK